MSRLFKFLVLPALLLFAFASSATAAETQVLKGRISADQRDWLELPFEVPAGTDRIDVTYEYDRAAGNGIDLAVRDTNGHRGASGTVAKRGFTITPDDATPGYRPGPIEPGRWTILLGPKTVVPAGVDYTVTIKLTAGPGDGPVFVPKPAPQSVPGTGPAWYRGDLHVHTVHSDSRFTQADVITRARSEGLDYFFSTEHNSNSANLTWGNFAQPGLLTGNGQEVTTYGGHWNAIGLPSDEVIEWRYREGQAGIEAAQQQVRDAGGLSVINHPTAPWGAWKYPWKGMDAVEIWNGALDADNETALRQWNRYLRRGLKITAVGASDAHGDPDVLGSPQTVVGAKDLSTASITAALRQGRAYIARDRATAAELSVRPLSRGRRGSRRPAEPGDTISGRRAVASVRVRGVDEGTVTFVTEGGSIVRDFSGGDQAVTARVEAGRYIRAEVRTEEDKMAALTNPVWVRSGR